MMLDYKHSSVGRPYHFLICVSYLEFEQHEG
jgi:hypothetical protein